MQKNFIDRTKDFRIQKQELKFMVRKILLCDTKDLINSTKAFIDFVLKNDK